MKEGIISNMHPICNLSNHHLLPLAVYTFFGLEYRVKYVMCLLESDSHLIPWTLNGAKVIHFGISFCSKTSVVLFKVTC